MSFSPSCSCRPEFRAPEAPPGSGLEGLSLSGQPRTRVGEGEKGSGEDRSVARLRSSQLPALPGGGLPRSRSCPECLGRVHSLLALGLAAVSGGSARKGCDLTGQAPARKHVRAAVCALTRQGPRSAPAGRQGRGGAPLAAAQVPAARPAPPRRASPRRCPAAAAGRKRCPHSTPGRLGAKLPAAGARAGAVLT